MSISSWAMVIVTVIVNVVLIVMVINSVKVCHRNFVWQKQVNLLKKQLSERKFRFADDGANFSINSDDPMVTGTWTQQVGVR